MYINNVGFPASSRRVRFLCAGFALAALCFSQTVYALTWHSAKKDQTLEGDFIELNRGTAPPQGAVDAQVKITSVKFVGGTKWEPGT